MKIEKVKNYNQKLLAILGTLAALFLVIALIAFISIIIKEHRDYSSYDDVETGILSDEKIEKLQKENKRLQVISYETPKLIDTLKSIYIIPVSHKMLNQKEDINGILNAFSGASGEQYASSDNRYSSGFYGAYNNVIIYDLNNQINKKLFDKRVNFNTIHTEYFDNDILLLMQASEKDTYKDGVINLEDFKSLYIYSFKQKEMKKVSIEGMDVFNYKFLNNSTDLIIEFGIDKNNDGQYESYNEPILIKTYDFKSGTLSDIIDNQTHSELQKTLEGSEQ
ncbi:hypothetical protein [Olleya namhaensis]|uniref:Uncharacterized protein n=1 Tax=Olleya namhaensis TaxID=1144750 RepID=A0A1I3QBI9_9FLAO|nr:hypothetical protein [Olleya namhaensis]SFJ30681.1 hypothetical protein SAMN05443431_10648 [Olleya namhaensis]